MPRSLHSSTLLILFLVAGNPNLPTDSLSELPPLSDINKLVPSVGTIAMSLPQSQPTTLIKLSLPTVEQILFLENAMPLLPSIPNYLQSFFSQPPSLPLYYPTPPLLVYSTPQAITLETPLNTLINSRARASHPSITHC